MKELPVIVTDLDGVVVNVMEEVLETLWRAFGVALKAEDCWQYEVHESFFPHLDAQFGSIEALDHFLARNCWTSGALFARSKPYFDMWCALQAFQDLGGQIVALTGRAPTGSIKSATRDWLDRWGFKKTELRFARERDKWTGEPEAKCEDVRSIVSRGGSVWFVDDQPATCAEVHKAGLERVTVYMPVRPWTKEEFGERSVPKRYIIRDIEELVLARGEVEGGAG